MAKQFKYRINELLNQLPFNRYKATLNFLPDQLGISAPTFNNYRGIELGDKQDIPHAVVDKLEKFFSLAPGGLQNYTSEIKPLKEMENVPEKGVLATKYGLTKA
jgi:hypothetical protein